MNLFNRKTLKRHIKPAPVPADHLAALNAWANMIHSGRVYALKKIALHGQFAAKIIEGVLGCHGPTGGADHTVSTEQAILQGIVGLALGWSGGKTLEILAPFELKVAATRYLDAIMQRRNKAPFKRRGNPCPFQGAVCRRATRSGRISDTIRSRARELK